MNRTEFPNTNETRMMAHEKPKRPMTGTVENANRKKRHEKRVNYVYNRGVVKELEMQNTHLNALRSANLNIMTPTSG